MKLLLLVFIILMFSVSCKKEITIEQNGMIKTIEVEDIKSRGSQIIKIEEGAEQAEIRHCETSGYCYGYGYDTGKYRHYWGYHHDCEGERRARFIPVVTTYRDSYQTEQGNFISPIKQSYEKRTTWTSSCER